MNSELLVAIEDVLRARFGDVKIERTVNDVDGTVRISVYKDARNFAKSITLSKDLVQQYNDGTLLA